MTIGVFQSLFEVPVPAGVTQTPTKGHNLFDDPPIKRTNNLARGGLGAATGFASFQDSFPWCGETQPVQPPAFRRKQARPELAWRCDQPVAPLAAHDWGFEPIPATLLRDRPSRYAAWLPTGCNVEDTLVVSKPVGWVAQGVQPSDRAGARTANWIRGEPDIVAPFITYRPFEWGPQTFQPPVSQRRQPLPESTRRIDYPPVGPVPLNWGFEPLLPLSQSRHRATDPENKIAVAPPPLTPAPEITLRPVRLLSSPGRARQLATPGRVRNLQA